MVSPGGQGEKEIPFAFQKYQTNGTKLRWKHLLFSVQKCPCDGDQKGWGQITKIQILKKRNFQLKMSLEIYI